MATLRSGGVLNPELEMQSPSERQRYLGERLRDTVARAYANAPRVRKTMDELGLKPSDIAGPEDLKKLPITYKDSLASLQAADPPFGGLLSGPVSKLRRIFMSPGPNYVPQPQQDDFWRFRMAFAAAGLQPGDIVHNSLSYHLSPGGFMLDAGLRSLGCVAIPGGTGPTELQVRVAFDMGVTGYVGTPSFLYTLLTKARELGTPLKIKAAFVTRRCCPSRFEPSSKTTLGFECCRGTRRRTSECSPTNAWKRRGCTFNRRRSWKLWTSRTANRRHRANQAWWSAPHSTRRIRFCGLRRATSAPWLPRLAAPVGEPLGS